MVQTELSDSINIKCSGIEIKQSIFSKSQISWKCFGNIFLEITNRRFNPKSKIQSNYLEPTEETQASCETVGQHSTVVDEAPFQSSLHRSSGNMNMLGNPH